MLYVIFFLASTSFCALSMLYVASQCRTSEPLSFSSPFHGKFMGPAFRGGAFESDKACQDIMADVEPNLFLG
ncbi:hypothetical protein DL95DRAFT_131979 [Leptodontidium sp. 2 PMI_412]|nr:hypothetical protein DL95DRAFT_131979 [Leptodontidium sp. 2 PMI_412]